MNTKKTDKKVFKGIFLVLIASVLVLGMMHFAKADDGYDEDSHQYRVYNTTYVNYTNHYTQEYEGDHYEDRDGYETEYREHGEYDDDYELEDHEDEHEIEDDWSYHNQTGNNTHVINATNTSNTNTNHTTGNNNTNNHTNTTTNTTGNHTGNNTNNNNNNTTGNHTGNNTNTTTNTSNTNTTNTQQYTTAIVATHNTQSNCWVIVFNGVYNITSLTNTHSGGNVFTCGTNATASYQSVHGTNVNRLKPYLLGNLTATSSSNTNTTSNTTTNTSNTNTTNNNNNSNTNNNTTNTNNNNTSNTNTTTNNGAITESVLAQHNTYTNCWVSVFGEVYDMTTLIDPVTGGFGLVCGADNSAGYQSVHGTNTNMLQPYHVGTFAGTTQSNTNTTTTNNTNTNTTTNTTGNSTTNYTNTTQQTTTMLINVTTNITLTAADVATHNTPADCWEILFGKIYNMTSLVDSHSGGNLFSCGTDQTALYQSRHGTNLNRMIPYYIADVGVPRTITEVRNVTVNVSQVTATQPALASSVSFEALSPSTAGLASDTGAGSADSTQLSLMSAPAEQTVLQEQRVTLASIIMMVIHWFFG